MEEKGANTSTPFSTILGCHLKSLTTNLSYLPDLNQMVWVYQHSSYQQSMSSWTDATLWSDSYFSCNLLLFHSCMLRWAVFDDTYHTSQSLQSIRIQSHYPVCHFYIVPYSSTVLSLPVRM